MPQFFGRLSSLFYIALILSLPSFKVFAQFDIENLLQAQNEETALAFLPGQKLSLPFVIAQAALRSETYKAATAIEIETEAARLKAQAPLETRLIAETFFLDDRLETANEIQPSRLYTGQASLGVEKGFRQGTELSAKLIHRRSEQQIDFFPELSTDVYESRLELGLRQPLWRNAFGRSTRYALESGELMTRLVEFELQGSIEEWFFEFTNIFYNAWLAQARVLAAQSNLERRQKLLDITEIRIRRGTAERPDFLQAQSALIESEANLDRFKKELNDIWKGLVVGLGLPEHWINFDPMKIPLDPQGFIDQAIELCGPEGNLHAPPRSDVETQKLELQAKTANQRLKMAEDSMRPDAHFFLTASTNAIDGDRRAQTFGDISKIENNSIRVGVNLTIPLERFSQRAELKEAMANDRRLDALASQVKKNLNVNWLNTCGDIYQQRRSINRLERIYQNQKERSLLEEERFRIGRVQMLSVIQAGDDAASAELALRSAQQEFHLSVWEVMRIQDRIIDTISDYTLMIQSGNHE